MYNHVAGLAATLAFTAVVLRGLKWTTARRCYLYSEDPGADPAKKWGGELSVIGSCIMRESQ